MTHYTDKAGSVRVDRFKESGKWYDSFALDMSAVWETGPTVYEAAREAVARDPRLGSTFIDSWLKQGGSIVILEPYHKNAHPIMFVKYIPAQSVRNSSND